MLLFASSIKWVRVCVWRGTETFRGPLKNLAFGVSSAVLFLTRF